MRSNMGIEKTPIGYEYGTTPEEKIMEYINKPDSPLIKMVKSRMGLQTLTDEK
jgi:hypothetical protein